MAGKRKANTNGRIFEDKYKFANQFKNVEGLSIDERGDITINGTIVGTVCGQYKLGHYMKARGLNYKDILSKRQFPDDCLIDYTSNTMYIIESKYQERSGSVDEKLESATFKRAQYQKVADSLFPGMKVEYAFIFNDWFKNPRYADVLQHLRSNGIEYYFNEFPDVNLFFNGRNKGIVRFSDTKVDTCHLAAILAYLIGRHKEDFHFRYKVYGGKVEYWYDGDKITTECTIEDFYNQMVEERRIV